jgi:hypothetical protein
MNVARADFASRSLTNVTPWTWTGLCRPTFGVNGGRADRPGVSRVRHLLRNYHGTYVPPFCHAQARAVFDTVK